VTRDAFDRAELAVRLRLSTHQPYAQTWQEWANLLDARLKVTEMYTRCGERPTHESVVCLAADAFALLAAVEEAEMADPTSGQEAA
jgi:hypothetical protein